MANEYPPLNPKAMAYFEALNRTANALADEVTFLLAVNEMTLHILIKQAYLLERMSSTLYDLEDSEAITGEQIETTFKEIRRLFEAQQELMQRGADDDETK